VPPGDLTPHGRDLIKILGAYYGEWLDGEHLLSRDGCRDAHRVYIWADTDQRTLETGRAFAESVLPGCGIPTHSLPEGGRDPLFSGTNKADPGAAADALRQRLGRDPRKLLRDHRAALGTLQFILTGEKDAPKRVIGGGERVAAVAGAKGVELEGPFAAASSLSEALLLEYADGMPERMLGWGRLTRQNLYEVLDLHRVYADLMRRTPYLARARASNLIGRIRASMEQASTGRPVAEALGPPATAVLILSGHDTNQSNVSGMLGLSWTLPGYQPDETPPGGALIFSLWSGGENRGDFVRAEYLAASLHQMRNADRLTLASPPLRRRVQIPGCGATSQHPDCSWARFKMMLQPSAR